MKILFKILFLIFLSIIFLHLFAFFGFIIAFAYPVIWIFAQKFTICIVCKSKKIGDYCSFCKQKVPEKYPNEVKTFGSALKNALVLLLIAFISFLFLLFETKVMEQLNLTSSPKTVSFTIPSQKQFRIDEIFPMDIQITGIETPVNAVQTDISFNPEKVEVIDIVTEDSFADIFLQKEINNEAGFARLTGGVTNPGFLGQNGVFGTVLFKAKQPGLLQISFLPTSLVLANDGKGSNVLKDVSDINYLIIPERISPEEAELQKTIELGARVLGSTEQESTTDTKLYFYSPSKLDSNDIAEVKGVSNETSSKIAKHSDSFVVVLIRTVHAYNEFVLKIYLNISHFIQNIIFNIFY